MRSYERARVTYCKIGSQLLRNKNELKNGGMNPMNEGDKVSTFNVLIECSKVKLKVNKLCGKEA